MLDGCNKDGFMFDCKGVNRVAVLVENANDTGGNRVIYREIGRLSKEATVKLTVAIVPRAFNSLKDIIGNIRDIIRVKLKVGVLVNVVIQHGLINLDRYDLVVSTSRRTLLYIEDHSDTRHCHLFQHIEAWESLDSPHFLDFCSNEHYPNGLQTLQLIEKLNLNVDSTYIQSVKSTKKFITVSNYLKNVALAWGADTNEIKLWFPAPHILNVGSKCDKFFDLLIFLRGHQFKGDKLSIELIRTLAPHYKIAVITHAKYLDDIDKINESQSISVFVRPSDEVVQSLYGSTKLVVHTSLSEGFGSIPQEALSFGCIVVASRTGWLQEESPNKNLYIIDRHNRELYINAIESAFHNI